VSFFNAIKGNFPTPLTWNIPNDGDEIDDATGTLVGGWSGTAGGPVAATGTAAHAAGVGGYIQWNTNAVVNGRRVKGRTFLCPLKYDDYDAAGTLTSATITDFVNAAAPGSICPLSVSP